MVEKTSKRGGKIIHERDIQKGQQTYADALRNALESEEVTEREEILRAALNEITSAEIDECLTAHEGLPVIGAQVQLSNSLGMVRTPAYFVGDRFLAGPQTAESIGRALDEIIAEAAAFEALNNQESVTPTDDADSVETE